MNPTETTELLTGFTTKTLQEELIRRQKLEQASYASGTEGPWKPFPEPRPQPGPNPSVPQKALSTTVRGVFLRQAMQLTEGNRNAAYGSPIVNLGAHGQLARILDTFLRTNPHFNNLASPIQDGLRGSLYQICSKLSRIACGDPLRADNYVDGAAYFAIAGEIVASGGASAPPSSQG